MKKLFFSALVAIVAVGGALSTNAQQLYIPNSSDYLPCISTISATCFNQTGVAWATDEPNQGSPLIDVSSYTFYP